MSQNLEVLASNKELTMSSLEIAELVGSRHDHVIESIERCAERGAIVQPAVRVVSRKDKMGRDRKINTYVFSGEQGKRDSIVVMAQLSPAFTGKIVDRWQELEAKNAAHAFTLPDFTNPAVSARAWAEQYEARLLAVEEKEKALEKVDKLEDQVGELEEELVEAKPKVDFVNTYVDTTNSKGVRAVAKLLNVGERAFVDYLLANKIMYRLHGELTPYQPYLEKGYFEVKTGLSESGHNYNSSRFTPKGITWITKRLAK